MIRTRFAPSPTGFLHIGGLRTAVYAYALARHNQGQFILRIEDTDQKREVPGAREKIYDILKVFGLNWDERYIQSERVTTGIYTSAAEKLTSTGHAFYCQCPARNAKTDTTRVVRDPCRDKNFSSGAIKLKVPEHETITFHDFVINKDISWNSDDVADVTLLKSDGFPTYHLAVVIDDSDMRISHVIRAAEWLTSTPVHLLVYRYLGLTAPQIGHPSDILDPSGGKLSKRKGNISCEEFIAAGYLPEALLNFIILLGWAPKDNHELYSLTDFVSAFDPNGFQRSNPVFHIEKLNWFNGQYIRRKSDTELTQLVKPFVKTKLSDTLITQTIPLVKDRLVTLADFNSLTDFFITTPPYSSALWADVPLSLTYLQAALEELSLADWTKSGIEDKLLHHIASQGWKKGDFFMSLRLAVCGKKITPPLTETMLILGKDESLSRIQTALKSL